MEWDFLWTLIQSVLFLGMLAAYLAVFFQYMRLSKERDLLLHFFKLCDMGMEYWAYTHLSPFIAAAYAAMWFMGANIALTISLAALFILGSALLYRRNSRKWRLGSG